MCFYINKNYSPPCNLTASGQYRISAVRVFLKVIMLVLVIELQNICNKNKFREIIGYKNKKFNSVSYGNIRNKNE